MELFSSFLTDLSFCGPAEIQLFCYSVLEYKYDWKKKKNNIDFLNFKIMITNFKGIKRYFPMVPRSNHSKPCFRRPHAVSTEPHTPFHFCLALALQGTVENCRDTAAGKTRVCHWYFPGSVLWRTHSSLSGFSNVFRLLQTRDERLSDTSPDLLH